MEEVVHVPVLLDEVVNWLRPRSGGRYIDATVGGGGHAIGILKASSPEGKLLGIDSDPEAIALARKNLAGYGARATLVKGNFADLEKIAARFGFFPADGVLFDLGLSSIQLSSPERGFSFRLNGPLDMRFDPEAPKTASYFVNEITVDELAEILYRYGEEKQAKRIASAIVKNRPISTTRQLAEVVEKVVGHRRRTHPATKTFMALRIAVNDELKALSEALPQALNILAPGGRLAVISYHSLEDRIVKGFFRRESKDCICPPEALICTCNHKATLKILTPKPIRPSAEEVAKNPRSRSAKLRIAVCNRAIERDSNGPFSFALR